MPLRQVQKRLEHQHPPERPFAVRAAEMGAPDLLDALRIENAAPDFEKILGPWAQRAAQPVGKRKTEAALFAIDHRLRDEAREESTEEPLAAAVADLHRERQRPRKLDE